MNTAEASRRKMPPNTPLEAKSALLVDARIMAAEMTPNNTQLLRKAPLFLGVDDAAMEAVLDVARERSMLRGVFFFRQGDAAKKLLVLVEGRVKFTQINAEGRQVTLKVIGRGEVFGSMSILGDEEYPYSARTLTGASALEWDGAAMTNLMKRFPPIAMNALRIVLLRLKEAQNTFRHMATERVGLRLARVIARLAEDHGRPGETGILIEVPLTRQELADMAGTTLFTVSRILNDWQKKGFVRVGRQRVILATPHHPKDFVDRFLLGLPVS